MKDKGHSIFSSVLSSFLQAVQFDGQASAHT